VEVWGLLVYVVFSSVTVLSPLLVTTCGCRRTQSRSVGAGRPWLADFRPVGVEFSHGIAGKDPGVGAVERDCVC